MKKILFIIICLIPCLAFGSHSDGKQCSHLYLTTLAGEPLTIAVGPDKLWIEEITPDHKSGDECNLLTVYPEGYLRIWLYWGKDFDWMGKKLTESGIPFIEYNRTEDWFYYYYLSIPKTGIQSYSFK